MTIIQTNMIEELEMLLDFSPLLIAAFAGLSMLTVQMLKKTLPFLDKYGMLINFKLSIFFAAMVVLEVPYVLETALIAFLIMTSASGIYGSVKKQTTVVLPDYSDDK